MKPLRLSLILVTVLSQAALAANAQDRFRLDLGLGAFELGGSYDSFNSESALGSLDLESDLGLGESQDAPLARLVLSLTPRNRVTFDYLQVDETAHGERELVLEVAGVPVQIGAEVDARFSLESMRLAYTLGLVSNAMVDFEVSMGLERLEAEGEVTARDTLVGVLTYARSDSRSETGPVIGAGLQVRPIPRFELAAAIAFARLPISDGDVTFSDIEASAAFRLIGGLWARGGFRRLQTDVDDDTYMFDISATGAFLGISLRY